MRNVAFACEGIRLGLRELPVSLSSCHHGDHRDRYGQRVARSMVSRSVVTSQKLDEVHNAVMPPHPAGGRLKRSSILWLRIGSLRLGDNTAVKAASSQGGFLLPVVTVQQRHLTARALSAISALMSSFRTLQSTVIVVVVRDGVEAECACLKDIAAKVNARDVFVKEDMQLNVNCLTYFREARQMKIHMMPAGDSFSIPSSLSSYGSQAFLFRSPNKLPPLPHVTNSLSSNVHLGGVVANGEGTARLKLSHLLNAEGSSGDPAILLSSILKKLSEEIRLGCLCRARVAHEVQRKRRSEKRFIPNDAMRRAREILKDLFAPPAVSAMSISAFDVNGGDRRGVEWDGEKKAFVLKEWEHTETERRMKPRERWQEFWRRRHLFFMRAFFPDDVTPDYYSFTAWRFAQRCCSATIGVFGTSSLLFAIGIRSGRIGQAAVVSWVLKDGLGRVGKMLWAGSMGKDFDVDPKRWRFRSALLYAMGNGLEIVTQIFPASFLVFATAANSMKQVSMLTASACRNAMYRSFGGRSQNIANITAKGEAQIVVADLIGMGCGIRLSKLFGASRRNLLGMYLVLTAMDIFGIYMELRQVVFRTLNAERSSILTNHYIRHGDVMRPLEVSHRERIFRFPRCTHHMRLTSIAKAARDPEELNLLLKIFKREHFLISVPQVKGSGPCRLVLRNDATNEDVLRAILTIAHIDQHLKHKKKKVSLEEEEYILRTSCRAAKRQFPALMQGARDAGWNTDSLLFSTLKRRGSW